MTVLIVRGQAVHVDDDIELNENLTITRGDVILIRSRRLLRRYVMDVHIGDRRIVLHRNGNHLDCRRANLDIVNRSQWRTGWHYSVKPPNVTATPNGRYRVEFVRQGQLHRLGLFDTLAEALQARDAALLAWNIAHGKVPANV